MLMVEHQVIRYSSGNLRLARPVKQLKCIAMLGSKYKRLGKDKPGWIHCTAPCSMNCWNYK